eukprot:CAMPEP_0174933404 /NCGR_PEP_ID=MMETSP1355-20121228/45273_1 /TAXON_ID=464990 /ORGANISM="Hemiselmis tepida, Strain CCMP443" /LENGTH=122 /DNA_ID=CAMNT_0016179907 /DNA_START=40 /DNA_END=407 /DNA_ORIENTATION=-
MATRYAATLLTAEVEAAKVQKSLGTGAHLSGAGGSHRSAGRRRHEGALSVIEERDELWEDDDEVSVSSGGSEDSRSAGSGAAIVGFLGGAERTALPALSAQGIGGGGGAPGAACAQAGAAVL